MPTEDCRNPASDKPGGGGGEAAIDRITSLPDHVRLHILSFLSTKNAVKTSALSKEWQFLWTSVPTIDFSVRIPSNLPSRQEPFILYDAISPQIIHKTLTLHSSPKITKFAIAVPPFQDSTKSQIDGWLRLAVSRHVEALELYFSSLNRFKYLVPSFLFNNPTLRELTITDCLVRLPACVHLPSLKTLSVRGAKFRGCSVGDLLKGCPSLEYLRLTLYSGGENLMLFSSSLKELSISLTTSSSVLEVCAPNLQTLSVYGDFCSRNHRLMDVSSLVHVSLTLSRFAFASRSVPGMSMSELTSFKELLQQLVKVENLTLRTFGTTHSQIQSDNAILEEAKAFWRSQQKEFFACLQFTIKLVEFSGFVPNKFGWEFMDPLVEFLLNNALALKKMIICWDDRTVREAPNSNQAQELCIAKRRVLDYKKASPKARVIFRSTKLL